MVLQQAIQEAIDNGIPRTSSLAAASHKAANHLLQWVSKSCNAAETTLFTSSLLKLLNDAFAQPISSQAAREKMWSKYHVVRTSHQFTSLWCKFLFKTGVPVEPICYQTITEKLFEMLIRKHSPVMPNSSRNNDDLTLTYEEENAIRYAAGYVLRAARRKLMKKVSNLNREDLVEAIDTLVCNSDDDDDDLVSTEWLDLIDRGGLIRISDDLYRVFVAMELEVRKFFRVSKANQLEKSCEGEIIHCILSNEDVLFFWCMVCSNTSEELSEPILEVIVELWVTIRGFSFARSFMELYKQKSKKNLQKSKALRKSLSVNL